MPTMDHAEVGRLARTGGFVDLAALAALVAGAFGAADGWVLAALLLLGGLVARLANHLVVGVAGYRWTMSHPWPQVRPLEDDDW